MEEAPVKQARKVVQGGVRRRLVADQDMVVLARIDVVEKIADAFAVVVREG